MWLKILLLGILMLPGLVRGQISLPSKADFKGPVRPFFTAGFQTTSVFQRSVRFVVLEGGLEWNRRLRLGFEHQWLASNIRIKQQGLTEKPLELRLYGLVGEYSFLINQRWELAATQSLGWGSTELPIGLKRSFYWIPGAKGVYRFVPFLGLGAAIGYRVMVGEETSFQDLSGLNISTSIKLFPVELISFIKSGTLSE